jgi:periplasmic protein TonB
MTTIRTRLSSALGVSMALHLGLALIAIVLWSVHSGHVLSQPPVKLHVYYVAGDAGGGGGSPMPAPPRPMQVPPHEPAPAITAAPTPVDVPPRQTFDAFVRTDIATTLQYSGTSLLPAAGPGGEGTGPGAGPGSDRGVGPGSGGNTGGGPRRAGGDVLPPTLIRSVDPTYTSDAMLSKIQGTVELEAVVLANGSIGDVRVTRSLDRVHGLDQEAIRAAKQWQFRPGTQAGKPVDVIVTLIIDFSIH